MPSIFGYFKSREDAERAAGILRNKGYSQLSVDTINRYSNSNNTELNSPIAPNVYGLSSLVLTGGSAESHSGGVRPLLGADPMVSGMGNYKEIAESNNLLVVVTEQTKIDDVKTIIKQCNGQV